jgi:hypothetical protein
MLRELLYIEEVDSDQKVWIEPLRKLLFTAKEAASEAKDSGNDQIDAQRKNSIFRRYGKIVKQADELNPQPPKRTRGPGPPVKKREAGPTPRSIINRLQKKRDEILRFMTDLTAHSCKRHEPLSRLLNIIQSRIHSRASLQIQKRSVWSHHTPFPNV